MKQRADEGFLPAWISTRQTVIDEHSVLGNGVRIHDRARVLKSTIGKLTLVGPGATICFAQIGNFCSIAWNASIGATQHPVDRLTTHEFPIEPVFGLYHGTSWLETHPEVTIENDVWIGCHSVVLPGVTIANGAIVGAGAVVTKDVTAYTIVAGIPARAIRRRFNESVTQRLERLAWWDWPANKLASCIGLFREPVSERVLQDMERMGQC